MTTELYTIHDYKEEEGGLTCSVSYNAMHDIFKGHFPESPIVPGVSTLAMIKDLLEDSLKRPVQLRESTGVKYLGLITPAMRPALTISWKSTDDNALLVSANLSADGASLFKMAASYQYQ